MPDQGDEIIQEQRGIHKDGGIPTNTLADTGVFVHETQVGMLQFCVVLCCIYSTLIVAI